MELNALVVRVALLAWTPFRRRSVVRYFLLTLMFNMFISAINDEPIVFWLTALMFILDWSDFRNAELIFITRMIVALPMIR